MTVALTLSLCASICFADEQQPQVRPTRDVEITYKITRPHQPKIIERIHWLASEHLQRVDGPDKSSTIFDRDKKEITVLNGATRTFQKLEGQPRQPMDPTKGDPLKRGDEQKIAGLRCVDWSWAEDTETHTACLTADGVMLRLQIDGNTIMEALSVTYRGQNPKLFEIPAGYSPALAASGGSE